jgi:tetratricopeptide (TPR) repeat protein
MNDSPDLTVGGLGAHTADAITNYKSAENVWGILVVRMPDKTDWMRQSTEVGQKLTRLLVSQSKAVCGSRGKDVKLCSEAAVTLGNKFAQNSPDTALQHRGELAVAYVSLGDVFEAIGDKAESIKQYQEAVTIIDDFTNAYPNHSGLQALNELRNDVCNKHSDVCQ